eukprot:TRINITY_DN45_c0_g1_i2.p1 TRINITY_DN45_c0_g1~~TRINITY_DN45_c0_g1_i2.p1  ORF type:complete len:338 (-),score=92.67 TRINITY_DN45_c0_g1_i2:53-1066(-)
MSGGEKTVSKRKQVYYENILKKLDGASKILIVTADNVGSKHMQSIRAELRGKATLLMGKNTLMRKAMRQYAEDHPEIEILINHVNGNCGLVFVNDDNDLASIRKTIISNKIGAYAKVGSVSPCDVIVPKGNTGMDPGKTSFFQALAIPTKINRGKVEISSDVHLLSPGVKVSQSAAVLLQMMDIKPFSYYLQVNTVYDNGSVFDPSILDFTDDDILAQFRLGVSRVAALGVSVGIPTIASVPANVYKGYEKLLALSVATAYTFKGSEKIKKLLEDPEALAALQASAAAAAPAAGGEAAPEKKEEDEDAQDMGGLFGGDSDDSEGGGMGGLFGGSDSD